MLSSFPRIRCSISSSSTSALTCKSSASSVSRFSAVITPSSTQSSQSTSPPQLSSLPLHTHIGIVGTRRSYSQCEKSKRSYYSQHQNNHQLLNHASYPASRQLFSADSKQTKKKDLRDSIERLKSSIQSENSNSGDTVGPNNEKINSSHGNNINPLVDKITSFGTSFLRSLAQTWDDLIASGQAKDINKKIGTPSSENKDGEPNYANDDEAADKYEKYKGSKDIMVIDPSEHLSAWERMERRLRDAPIIQDILEKSQQVYERSGAKTHVQKTQQRIQHLREDAEEAWETSQNPWVYRASSVYDTLTAESEFATASRQLQKLDPEFTLETWKRDVVEHTLPRIMKLFLEGRITELKPWLGEAVYNRLAAEVRARKKEGVQMDTNVLAIMNAEILACEVEGSSVNVERGDDPIILLHFMCQQIHCVRKKVKHHDEGRRDGKKSTASNDKEAENEDANNDRVFMEEELGDIVEGGEDDIRANSYVVAFQREYNEEKMELNWKIVDFRFNGAIAYL